MVEMNSLERDFQRDGTSPPTSLGQPTGQLTSDGNNDPETPSSFPPGGPHYPGYGDGTGNSRRPLTGGRYDLLDTLWSSVNQDLLMAKTFYFFFFSAFGSLFPLMAIFFKQLGMNPVQCGLLIGFRPFVEFLSAPFWGTIADRYQRGKQILMFSLLCWVVFTLALCFISPPATLCIYNNSTHDVLTEPDQGGNVKRSLAMSPLPHHWNAMTSSAEMRDDDGIDDNYGDGGGEEFDIGIHRERRSKPHKLPPGHVIGQSPGTVHFTANYDPSQHSNYVSPVFSSIVYKKRDVQNVFFLILLLVVIGEFFSAPAITLADSVTLTYLGENANNYGKQRMFGSLGWGLAMFFVGIALDHSTVFPNHPCGPHERERNYTICFAVFSVLMGCAFMTATQLRFDYDAIDDGIALKPVQQQQQPPNDQTKMAANGGLDEQQQQQPPQPVPEPKPEKSTVFASKARQIPEWLRVLRTFANLRYGAFLFVAWFMGVGVGLVFTFLFWHLQDLGGTPTLFGVASVINHISEIFAYFFSFRLIRQIGHVRVLCLGLLGNLARFLYVSWLSNPWWVLPFEFIQGVTHAAVWAACCSYITQATPMTLRSSAQGVLQGLHHGLGRGCGAVLGGLLATYCGTAVTFRAYGFICLMVLVAFIFINYYQPDRGFASAESVEPHQVLEESAHLAPHGVPSGPMPRALSSSRLEDMDTNGGSGGFPGYGATEKQNGPFLDLPRQGGGGGGGGGGGWGQVEHSVDGPTDRSSNWPTVVDLANALRIQKHAPLPSPQAKFDYNYIQENFKVYSEVLNSQGSKDAGNDGNGSLLKAPPPKTVAHALQPVNHRKPSSYDW